MKKIRHSLVIFKAQFLTFLTIFGPATITAIADNDANGVATYAIAGAKLGYPILFLLFWVTILLAITQEMGMRLSIITRKGLGDLIRENYGVRTSIFVFIAVAVANLAVIVVNVVALKTTASLIGIPSIPLTLCIVIACYILVVRGNYKSIQGIMLLSSVLYVAYIFSAIKSGPDWGSALSNLIYPNGVHITPAYIRDYIVIGLGVIGTTITPWGQFFISSFSLDKKMDPTKLKFSQIETYWGAFLTDFFSFFMIVATAATLFTHGIVLTDGNQAALAIEPFAGKIASLLFAFGIMNAGFMGIITVGLATTYAFSEFFGFSRSLDTSYNESKQFYFVFGLQLVVATVISLMPGLDLFTIVVGAQIISAMTLPILFMYLIRFTNSKKFMGDRVNSNFQKWFAIMGTIIITVAAIFTVVSTLFGL